MYGGKELCSLVAELGPPRASHGQNAYENAEGNLLLSHVRTSAFDDELRRVDSLPQEEHFKVAMNRIQRIHSLPCLCELEHAHKQLHSRVGGIGDGVAGIVTFDARLRVGCTHIRQLTHSGRAAGFVPRAVEI